MNRKRLAAVFATRRCIFVALSVAQAVPLLLISISADVTGMPFVSM
jgi:hypothetical protein